MRETIETNRLKLRPLRASDAPRIALFVGDPRVGRNLAMTPIPYFEVTAEGWLMIMRARVGLKKDFVYGVELRDEGLIGCIGAHRRGDGGFEVGYWYGRPFWGRGFATEALEGLLEQARDLGPLQSGYFEDNPASGRVLEKSGFAHTGEVELLFSMARGEKARCRRMRYMGAQACGEAA